jgi:high-affinity K+ transport system ATPase subunit B
VDNLVKRNLELLAKQLLAWRIAVAVLGLLFLGFGIFDIVDGQSISFIWVSVIPVVLSLLLVLTSGQAFLTQSEKYLVAENARLNFEYVNSFDYVAVSRSGTLIGDRARVVLVKPIAGITSSELVSIAAAAQSGSQHVIGRAVVSYAERLGGSAAAAKDFRVIPGLGVTAIVDGAAVFIGGPGMLTSRNLSLGVDDLLVADQESEAGRTVIFVIRDSVLLGMLSVEYEVSDFGKALVYQLRKMRRHVVLISGDSHGAVKWLAEQLQIEKYFAEILPHRRDEVLAQLGPSVLDVSKLNQDLSAWLGSLVRGSELRALQLRNRYIAGLLGLLGLPLAIGLITGSVLSFVLGAVLISLSAIVDAVNSYSLRK